MCPSTTGHSTRAPARPTQTPERLSSPAPDAHPARSRRQPARARAPGTECGPDGIRNRSSRPPRRPREPGNDETPGQIDCGRELRDTRSGSSGNYPRGGSSLKSSTCSDVVRHATAGTGGPADQAQQCHRPWFAERIHMTSPTMGTPPRAHKDAPIPFQSGRAARGLSAAAHASAAGHVGLGPPSSRSAPQRHHAAGRRHVLEDARLTRAVRPSTEWAEPLPGVARKSADVVGANPIQRSG